MCRWRALRWLVRTLAGIIPVLLQLYIIVIAVVVVVVPVVRIWRRSVGWRRGIVAVVVVRLLLLGCGAIAVVRLSVVGCWRVTWRCTSQRPACATIRCVACAASTTRGDAATLVVRGADAIGRIAVYLREQEEQEKGTEDDETEDEPSDPGFPCAAITRYVAVFVLQVISACRDGHEHSVLTS